ncbi:quinone-dependent dihydroorotate dehydrogenase [Wenyingzhuangia sp. 2_MG-2023]|uniref:quinone-dependent dihydroorotate dehydrogenase n=1 Tax=Wenyingzhuangia sp. 2_MG-2023 TaxID=3062639 RepID=UPI0026E1AC71|nr:quinone-dependent dihydroorotate dehydrogenase [Wenyingzhuangia sp. 2_MG-2023]MDO6738097.1 quinone-dependent dihydroorotate dehydrogenase [Wenyingzhuangia sp. 2_MG-2023]
MSLYKAIIRPIFFQFDPEKVHYFVFDMVKFLSKIPGVSLLNKALFKVEDGRLNRELFGIRFENPVGLAAGFDKNAVLFNELADFGFGFIEIGTVTPKGQEGNPKKRLFRLKEDQAIINRMGFNNLGVKEIVENLKSNKGKVIVGGNIGKNTNIATEQYTQDYCDVFEELHAYVDYFVLNVSCPNVSSHAKLGDKDYLLELIAAVQKINKSKKERRPILLKIAPDLNNIQLDEIIDLVAETKLDGVIASNTSVNRDGLIATEAQLNAIGNGGLSGKPVKDRSTAVIKYLAEKSNKAFPIIGVGGIHTAEDALEKIAAGADLVQVYTGFIYEGPALVKKINKAILKAS